MHITNNTITKSFALSVILCAVAAGFMYVTRSVVTLFLISAFIAYLLSPLVDKIMITGVKRWVAVVALVLIFVLIVFSALSFILPIIIEDTEVFISKFPEYSVYVKDFCSNLYHKFDNYLPFIEKYNIFDNLTETISTFVTKETAKIPKHIFNAVTTFSLVFLVPVITFFMLLSSSKTSTDILNIVPAKYVELVLSIMYEINFVMGRYIRGQVIEVCFVAAITIIGLSFFGVNYAFLIGVIAGLCNMIPYLGPAIGFILGVTVTAIQFKSWIMVIKVAVMFLLIQQADNHIMQPVVVGQTVNLSPVTMLFALLAGAQIGGFLGMLFAVPAAAIIKNILNIFIRRYKKIQI